MRVGVNQLLVHTEREPRSYWAQIRDPETRKLLREVRLWDSEAGGNVELWLCYFKPNYQPEEEKEARRQARKNEL